MDLVDKLQAVVEKRKACVDLTGYTPSSIEDTLKVLYKIDGYFDMETNGYQVDFWITYQIFNRKFIYSGCWYYGGATFREEIDNESI